MEQSTRYELTRKRRNTGAWWKSQTERISERKNVRALFNHWHQKANNPEKFTEEIRDAETDEVISIIVPRTPPPAKVPGIIAKHKQSWGIDSEIATQRYPLGQAYYDRSRSWRQAA